MVGELQLNKAIFKNLKQNFIHSGNREETRLQESKQNIRKEAPLT